MDILQYTFFQNALIGALLASILCGFVGTYIVTPIFAYHILRRLVVFFFTNLLQNSLAHPPYGIRGKGEATRLVELMAGT